MIKRLSRVTSYRKSWKSTMAESEPAAQAVKGDFHASFGLISDIQYADIDDGTDFAGVQHRYYRGSLDHVRQAVNFWNENNVSCVVQLGDIIDGKNVPNKKSEEALQAVLDSFKGLDSNCPRFDLIGNHECYNFKTDFLLKNLNVGENGYYSHSPHPRWRMIFLNAYDISIIGKSEDDVKYKEARSFIESKSPIFLKKNVDWFANLEQAKHRYAPYNGGLGSEQMDWLRNELDEADASGQLVLVISHVPVEIRSCCPRTVIWNSDKIIPMLHKHKNVVAVFAGHDHDGGFFTDEEGLHHWTFVAPLIIPAGEECYCVVKLHEEGIQVDAHCDKERNRFLQKRKHSLSISTEPQ